MSVVRDTEKLNLVLPFCVGNEKCCQTNALISETRRDKSNCKLRQTVNASAGRRFSKKEREREEKK